MVALVLGALAWPVVEADAQAVPTPTYTFTPASGPVGTTIHVTGTGCPPQDPATDEDLTFTLLNGPGRSAVYPSNPDGSFAFDYVIPPARAGEQEPDNTYPTSLTCLSTDQNVESGEFTITGPEYEFAPPSAGAGQTVQVSGLGCVNDDNAEQDGTFSFEGQPPVPFRAGDDYRFSFQFTVPSVPAGEYGTSVTCLSQQLQSPAGAGGEQLTGTRTFTVLSAGTTAPPEPTAPLETAPAARAVTAQPSFTG